MATAKTKKPTPKRAPLSLVAGTPAPADKETNQPAQRATAARGIYQADSCGNTVVLSLRDNRGNCVARFEVSGDTWTRHTVALNTMAEELLALLAPPIRMA